MQVKKKKKISRFEEGGKLAGDKNGRKVGKKGEK